ncbi:2Fe-2S iron-sulfur cluster-binding protein [Paraburkholderia sediminicola]|uniref:NAD(P)H-flavin reductase n=1 Tax=Paraburkholderia sediminicola TaxID=458836 RepID=UPI0038BD611A
MIQPITTERIETAGARTSKLVHGQVEQIEPHGPAVTVLRIRLAQGHEFVWLPGQYIDVLAEDGHFRSFSLARSALVDGCIELHIRRIPGGVFSDRAMRALKLGDRVSWRGPFGDFGSQRSLSAVHAVFICTSTGFAPVRAIVETIVSGGWRRPVSLYWGGRSAADLYLENVAREWARLHDNFRFIPVLSRNVEGIADARRGRVQRAVTDDFESLADADVYACGSPAMIEDARDTLIAQRGLHPNAFFSDPFGTVEIMQASGSGGSVRISANGIEHSMLVDQSLLVALRDSGVAIPSICGGRGACGTCMVEIDNASRATLASPGRDEQDLLECLPNVTPHSRLACQIRLDKSADGLAVSIL